MKQPLSIKIGLSVFLVVLALSGFFVLTGRNKADHGKDIPTSAELAASLPGFTSRTAQVNGINLHFVEGGSGTPLILLPGWPQTWWEYHDIMPELARHFRVIVVDIRGMGDSEKPSGGYDKKTMAKDISELVKFLKFSKVHIAGHDIGAQVAHSFAANHQDQTIKAAILDVPHPDAFYMEIRMLPGLGEFKEKAGDRPYPWWFAFHQAKELSEQLVQGKEDIYFNWAFNYLTKDSASISAKDRAIYVAAYSKPGALRASDGWYQAFPQDIADEKSYGKITVPMLGLGSVGYEWLKATLPTKGTNVQITKVENSGHFMIEEQPEFVTSELIRFFKSP